MIADNHIVPVTGIISNSDGKLWRNTHFWMGIKWQATCTGSVKEQLNFLNHLNGLYVMLYCQKRLNTSDGDSVVIDRYYGY